MRRGGPPAPLDRSPQHLPVPLGDLAAVHGHQRSLTVWRWRTSLAPALVGSAGVVAALSGGVLAATAPAPTVGLQSGGVMVGSALLPATSLGYGGPGLPAMVMQPAKGPVITATGNGIHDGVRMSGRCAMRQQGTHLTETCLFRVGARQRRAEDTLDLNGDGVWHRRYDDGERVTIRVPPGGAVTPVPFPIAKP